MSLLPPPGGSQSLQRPRSAPCREPRLFLSLFLSAFPPLPSPPFLLSFPSHLPSLTSPPTLFPCLVTLPGSANTDPRLGSELGVGKGTATQARALSSSSSFCALATAPCSSVSCFPAPLAPKPRGHFSLVPAREGTRCKKGGRATEKQPPSSIPAARESPRGGSGGEGVTTARTVLVWGRGT